MVDAGVVRDDFNGFRLQVLFWQPRIHSGARLEKELSGSRPVNCFDRAVASGVHWRLK
jgi:hypothetical protein